MKTCSYCGKEYADDFTACPIDGQTLIASSVPPQAAVPGFAAGVSARRRIAAVSIHQTSKVLAFLYVVVGLLFVPLGLLMIVVGQTGLGIVYLLMPIIYGVVGYPFIAAFCWAYNAIAKRTGGVEFTVEEERKI